MTNPTVSALFNPTAAPPESTSTSDGVTITGDTDEAADEAMDTAPVESAAINAKASTAESTMVSAEDMVGIGGETAKPPAPSESLCK